MALTPNYLRLHVPVVSPCSCNGEIPRVLDEFFSWPVGPISNKQHVEKGDRHAHVFIVMSLDPRAREPVPFFNVIAFEN
jgi:hypothetical protein